MRHGPHDTDSISIDSQPARADALTLTYLRRSIMRQRLLQISLLSTVLAIGCTRAAPVKLGIDVLRDQNFAPIAGKRVGVVVNPASVDGRLHATALVLKNARNVQLVALFGPEHGVWGDEYAGAKVGDEPDRLTGVPAFSLYGKHRKPTPEMLANVDVMVFDLQDIGSRSYTYINTMKHVLIGCAEADKPLIILDRPNPLGGHRVEGAGVDAGLESGVSSLDVPYIHGMTMGELALLTRDRLVPEYRKLSVIQMTGWRRDMMWQETGLDWVPTSPHIPHVSSVAAYAATGTAGELYQFSNGVGYTLPFEVVGAPDIDGVALAEKLNAFWPGKGLFFRPIRYKPFYSTHAGKLCGGVQVHIDPNAAPSLVEVSYRIIEALDAPAIMALANQPATKPTTQPDTAYAVGASGRRNMFDKVTGETEAGDRLLNRKDLAPMFARWKEESEAFKRLRAPYLLYR
jgi:uncharacterized protein YbbC (DUF1343 family)